MNACSSLASTESPSCMASTIFSSISSACWLAPATADDDGEHVPKQSKSACLREFRQPHFAVRRLDQAGWLAGDPQTWRHRAVRNGYQIATHSIPVSNPPLTEFTPSPAAVPHLQRRRPMTFSASAGQGDFDEHPSTLRFSTEVVLFDGGHKGVYQYCISNRKCRSLSLRRFASR